MRCAEKNTDKSIERFQDRHFETKPKKFTLNPFSGYDHNTKSIRTMDHTGIPVITCCYHYTPWWHSTLYTYNSITSFAPCLSPVL